MINEVLASNLSGLLDGDGNASDWIEIYNPGEETVRLEGWGLSDDLSNPRHWLFTQGRIDPGGFLVVFASGKDDPGAATPHTNFSISAEGEALILTNARGEVVDLVPPVSLPTNVSYGRRVDNPDEWAFFAEPTPGTANTSTEYAGVLEPPNFSEHRGYYDRPFELVLISNVEEGVVRYTLDGSEPGESAPVYTTPILIRDRSGEQNVLSLIPTVGSHLTWLPPMEPIRKGMVVRARTEKDGWLPSRTISHTFFVAEGDARRHTMPVFAVTTDPENLFDEERGIYVPGFLYDPEATQSNGLNWTGNYFGRGDEWERVAALEFFEEDGLAALAQDTGLRIHGGYTRSFPRKGLRFYARSRHGNEAFLHRLFPDHPDSLFRRFMLRAGGNDTGDSVFKDAMAQSLLDETGIEYLRARPTIVYINGEYWGIHQIRDRIDRHFFEGRYGLDSDRIDLLTRNLVEREGSFDHYDAMKGFIVLNNPAIDENFEALRAWMDVDNFVDYVSAQIYFANIDWPEANIDYWRFQSEALPAPDDPSHPGDGRWRWIVYDVDATFGAGWGGNADTDIFDRIYGLTELGFLMKVLTPNTRFRQLFLNTIADRLNTTFAPDRVIGRIDEWEERLAPEMPEHITRWNEPSAMWVWHHHVEVMRQFARERPNHLRAYTVAYYDLESTATLRLDMGAVAGGTIRVNRINLAGDVFPWEGMYFQGVPIDVEAIPLPGYRFVEWRGDHGGAEPLLAFDPGVETRLTAIFAEDETYEWIAAVPQPHPLASVPYTFSRWPEDAEPGTYPESMVIMQSREADPRLHHEKSAPWSMGYNLTNRSRVVGLGDDGLAFVNTGNAQVDGGGYLGAALLALDTRNCQRVLLFFTAGTVLPNNRVYTIRLQYRLGADGPFRDVPGPDGLPVEYIRHENAGHTRRFGPIALPPEMHGLPYVQLRWKYHYIETGVTGPRAMLRIDDILVRDTFEEPVGWMLY